ncbi:hypothetical protein Tco_1270097 [Tanacetum coccineum]
MRLTISLQDGATCELVTMFPIKVLSTNGLDLDWISAHNFLTCLQKLSPYTSGHFEVSELAACLEKLHFPTLLVMSKFSRIYFSLVILEVPLSEYVGFDMNYALNFLCSIYQVFFTPSQLVGSVFQLPPKQTPLRLIKNQCISLLKNLVSHLGYTVGGDDIINIVSLRNHPILV